ncbi:hypothetical protein QJS83_12845 [Bdellovibrio sp. 22V]|uniref:hypothetical protein n=1 Tax=Bdellovibrio sp. 22V TaxID=3044166 RepID=UPI002543C4EB|nr:hypothetical protein [Bdellovibrio sp. 22V]WII71351.1 hypothetical protein QJS83_12845 [Bdellovibrio sp. 22V]
MRRNAFLGYLLAQFIVIVLVMAIFKVIPDRQIAATVAGVLFVVLPAVLMALEYKRAELTEFFWFVAVLQFWTLFALPILGIRLANWGVPFDQLSFIGIPGPILHQWSSKSYTIMMAFTAYVWWKLRRKRPIQG